MSELVKYGCFLNSKGGDTPAPLIALILSGLNNQIEISTMIFKATQHAYVCFFFVQYIGNYNCYVPKFLRYGKIVGSKVYL